MANELNDKLRKVEDEHFGQMERSRLEDFDNKFVIEAHEFRGGLRAVTSIARSLLSKTIEGLMLVEDRNYYLAWINPATGETFKRFVEYLDSDEVPDLSKTKYYELKALLLTEGADAFDVFSGNKIPISTRKMLAAQGVEISVDGDDLVIANHRVPITDKAAMKELVETVHNVLRERDAREEKLVKDNADLKQTIQVGTEEFQQLERNLNALRDGNPYDRALSSVIHSMLLLLEQIGHLRDEQKPLKGKDAMESIWAMILQIRKSYGIGYNFTDATGTPASLPATGEAPDAGSSTDDAFEAKLAAAIAEPDELDNEEDLD